MREDGVVEWKNSGTLIELDFAEDREGRWLAATSTRSIELSDATVFEVFLHQYEAEPERLPPDESGHEALSPSHMKMYTGKIEPELKELFRSTLESLSAELDRVSGWITWRFELTPPQSLDLANLDEIHELPEYEFRFGDRDWMTVPGSTYDHYFMPTAFDALPPGALSAERRVDLDEGISGGQANAPFAWRMFQRALRLWSRDPKVATFLVVAAAEIAVKEFIASESRDRTATWLLLDEQAPPFHKLIRDGLKSVVPIERWAEPSRVIPKAATQPIEDAVKVRNKFVHSGMGEESDAYSIEYLMRSVSDLIYALAWLGGEDWAADYAMDTSSMYEWISKSRSANN